MAILKKNVTLKLNLKLRRLRNASWAKLKEFGDHKGLFFAIHISCLNFIKFLKSDIPSKISFTFRKSKYYLLVIAVMHSEIKFYVNLTVWFRKKYNAQNICSRLTTLRADLTPNSNPTNSYYFAVNSIFYFSNKFNMVAIRCLKNLFYRPSGLVLIICCTWELADGGERDGEVELFAMDPVQLNRRDVFRYHRLYSLCVSGLHHHTTK